jgi:hypothetical protein
MTFIDAARLRTILRQSKQELHSSEVELATRMAEIREFEAKIESRLGSLETEIEIIDAQIRHYQKQIYQLQQAEMFPNWIDYSRRANPNQHPPSSKTFDADKNASSNPENELRQLYRDLARRYHPDTAFDDRDRLYRTEMMMRINEAYANRDVNELRKHARGMITVSIEPEKSKPLRYRSALEKIEAELVECQTKLQETRAQIENLRFHPSVQLSLSVKLAWRAGRDLIGDMTRELQEQVTRKTARRDELLSELNQLKHG